jgi:hypothetical protein
MAKIKLDKLKKELDNKYKNSVIGEIKRFEEERQRVLDSFSGKITSKSAISDLQNTLKSSTLQTAFKTASDYTKYTNPLLEDIRKKDYQSLQEELKKSFTPYIKTEAQRAIEALDYTKKSLSELTKNVYPQADRYGADISIELKNMGINNNLLMSAKALTESMKKIETDMFKDKMEQQNIKRLEVPRMMESIKFPENPMIKQNKQIIKLLDIQNETLVSVGQYISSQNEKLDTQNKIVEEEIKDNKQAAKQAFWTAVVSIGIAIVTTIWAGWASYDIYSKEDKSSNIQHTELLKLINYSGKSDLIKEQTVILNKMLKAIEIKNSKINKVE